MTEKWLTWTETKFDTTHCTLFKLIIENDENDASDGNWRWVCETMGINVTSFGSKVGNKKAARVVCGFEYRSNNRVKTLKIDLTCKRSCNGQSNGYHQYNKNICWDESLFDLNPDLSGVAAMSVWNFMMVNRFKFSVLPFSTSSLT